MKKATFKVRIDRMGSMRIACHSGSNVTETGVRGLNILVDSGLMSAPQEVHIDPLHRYVDIDGCRFPCDDGGVRRLEAALNERYAREILETPPAIKVRESLSSPTGFEMEYITERDGIRRDVIVQLVPEEIDVLQDAARSGLIKPGVVVRLNPPYLIVRRRAPDGRETPIPELPDIGYRSASAAMIQHMLNHPDVLRSNADQGVAAPAQVKPRFLELRVVRHLHDNVVLWLECVPIDGGKPVLRALTHLNISNLQHDGVFQEHLEAFVPLDNHGVGVLDRRTKIEQFLKIDVHSPEEVLQSAGRMLTSALQTGPSAGAPVLEATPSSFPAPGAAAVPMGVSMVAKVDPHPHEEDHASPATRMEVPVPPEMQGLFSESDPVRINQSIFDELAADLEIPVCDVCFSLPRVFDRRRFRILNFEPNPVLNVMDLRGEDFYGFYLAELPNHGVDLVYACRGVHIEWGVDRCVLQPALRAESVEYMGHGLLGLAQDGENNFLFIVEPEYKEWVKPQLAACAAVNAKFATLPELAGRIGEYTLIWPLPVAEPTPAVAG